MSFRLKEAVYRIKCRAPGCTFVSEAPVRENIMGATQDDVDVEVLKIARNLAYIKHDSLFGRKHDLTNPEIVKLSSQYDRLETGVNGHAAEKPPNVHSFGRGQVISSKDEADALVFEIVRGSARNARHGAMTYSAGSGFGTGALFGRAGLFADIVATADETVVARHDFRELQHSNPAEARRLYEIAMADLFRLVAVLEKKVANHSGAAHPAARPAARKPAARAARASARRPVRSPRKAGAKKTPAKKPARRR